MTTLRPRVLRSVRRRRLTNVWLFLSIATAVAMLATGCSTPVGADRTTVRRGFEQVTASALEGELSGTSTLVLHRYGLSALFPKDPAGTLTNLHVKALSDSRRDILFALAELNYFHAEHVRREVKPAVARTACDYYLASAIYSYLFLFGPGDEPPPGPLDRRVRLTCDLYNRGVAMAFSHTPARPVDPTLRQATRSPVHHDRTIIPVGGERTPAPGQMTVNLVPKGFKWDFDEIESFLPADEFLIRGLTVRDRQAGIGAPLIVVGKTLDNKSFARRFPATLVLQPRGSLADWSSGRMKVDLELYSTFETQAIEVAGRTVPLEGDVTAPLAYALNDQKVWKLGSQQFFSSEEKVRSNIYLSQPYQPGKIPVLFVHGTFSSPVWWSEMWNTLRADPVLRERYQFWNFIYNSGNPVTYSAAHLRDMINRKVAQLDPEGKDPAITNMVVIGHSQGGLLTKLTVTETKDTLWNTVSKSPFEAQAFDSEADREALGRNFFFTPLPAVKRVVFISTPHRGSYLATSFVRKLARRFISLPSTAFDATATFLKLQGKEPVPEEVSKAVVTSLDQMSPSNPLLNALASIPVAPGVGSHSIIAIKGDDQPPAGGDGVVKYQSASVPYTDSEYIVRSGHSCQDKPATIEEVRRILLQHARQGVGKAEAPKN